MKYVVYAFGVYLLGVLVCGAFLWWGASPDHKEPL